MKRSHWPVFILVLLLAAASAFGFFRLFQLRFQAGDIYPPYSSLRSDPLGIKVLHDALDRSPGFTVSRNYQALDRIINPGGATILYAGVSTDRWDIRDVEQIEAQAKRGARIVVTFLPAEEVSKSAKAHMGKKSHSSPSATPSGEDPESENNSVDFQKVARDWGAGLSYRVAQSDSDSAAGLTAHSMFPETEPTLSWHTALYFPRPSPAWRVLYRCDGAPCILERPFGSGSIALAADSYFLSNEAMRAERAPRLLAWILGSHTRVIFDETHLGVHERPGISSLVRKYNLGGLIAAILILASLFVWQTSASFLPPMPDREETEVVIGKDSTAGFVSLLRRGIAPSRLMEVCVDQWKKSLGHSPGDMGKILARIESIALQGSREPVDTYRAISEILAEKK